MKNIGYLLIVLLWLVQVQVIAQKAITEDVVYLKNGSIIRGEIIAQEEGGFVKIAILGGSVFVFEQTEVERIEREEKGLTKTPRYLRPQQYSNKGLYHALQGGALLGLSRWNDVLLNGHIQYTAGYQFNRWLAVGAGTGLEFYEGVGFVPLYVHIQGYLFDQSFSPYYSYRIGYGIAAFDTWNNTTVKRGGFHSNPALGIRFETKNNTHFTLDFGLKFQEAHYTIENWGTREQDWFFMRSNVRLGILF